MRFSQFIATAENSQHPYFFAKPVYGKSGVIDFRMSFANAACEQMFVKRRRQLVGCYASDLFGTLNEAVWLDCWCRVAKTGSPEQIDLRIENAAVESKVTGYIVKVGDGVAVSISHDWSGEKARALELSEFAQSIIESAPISMIATDATGTIIAMNSAAERLTLYRKRELVGQHSLVLLHDPVEMSTHAGELNKDLHVPVPAGFSSLTAKAHRGNSEERECSYVRKDGSRIWVNLTMKLLNTPDNKASGYMAMAFDATERKKLADSVSHMEQHDQLTGLPNRSLMHDRLSREIDRAKRFGSNLALYIINIDHFKRINDALGSAGGDSLLKHVASQLSKSVRQSDTVARVGGDEFVVIMPDFREAADAERCADLMLQGLAVPVMVGDREVGITASIGYCLFPAAGSDATELLSCANRAMREAKLMGRGSRKEFSGVLKVHDRLEMEEELRRAFSQKEFWLQYQPQIDCRSGQVTGFEALLRWTSPTRGNVAPSEFIPIAEDIGLMVPISEWVFKRSCFDCVDLQQETGLPLTVAVNLSPRQFSQRSLPDLVEKVLADSGLHPKHLELEITEQMLMVNSDGTLETLREIRDLGVRIAIDDFGTGFSSFAYILQYNVDRIKIDRSFIANAMQDNNARAVVRAIIAMAHGLNMDVVAEGVETQEQHDFLLRRRCDLAQGFLFSRPVSKEDFPTAVQRIAEMSSDCGMSDRFASPSVGYAAVPQLEASLN